MERIPGTVLADCWSDLGWWKRFSRSCNLRSYIAQLRRLSGHMPGPPTDAGRVGPGPIFDMNIFGTFGCLNAFQYWCRIVALYTYTMSSQRKDKPLPWFSDEELGDLVFTHGDLHMGNLILGDDGRLWVIDWHNAGFYPRSMEAAAMWAFQRSKVPLVVNHIHWLAGRSAARITIGMHQQRRLC